MTSGTERKVFCGYPSLKESDVYYQRICVRAQSLGTTVAGAVRQMVWDFLENPIIDPKLFADLCCERQTNGRKTKRSRDPFVRTHSICAVSDARPLVQKFERIALAHGVSTSSLLRYVVRSACA